MEIKMLLQNDSLWNRLQEYSLDAPNVDFPFSKKLAKEENWTVDFTTKAIEEYKKFVYLCCVLPNGASPSEIVDKVWHMHLIYTQNYWEEFCPNILKRKLHHHPSKGGFAEKNKHQNWFSYTLKNYREIFQQDAPIDIWGNQNKIRPQKRDWFKKLRIIPFFMIFLLLTSCLGDIMGAVMSIFLAIVVIFSIGIGISSSQNNNDKKNNNDGSTGSSGCSGGSSCGGGSCGGGCGGCGG